MRIFETGGIALHWREDGDPEGLPVVFANSLGTDLRLWDDILPLLPGGLRLIRFDKRGHGLSDCPPGPYRIDDLADDAAALIGALGLVRPVFVGLSIGGMIGQVLAARDPGLLRGLVLSNTAARLGTADMWSARIEAIRAGGIESIAEAVLDRWFAPAYRNRPEVAAWRAMMTRTPAEGYIACSQAVAAADLEPLAPAIRVPTLGIAGSDDGASPAAQLEETVSRIAGAHCVTITGTGHLPCVEAPSEYAAILAAFLKEVAPL